MSSIDISVGISGLTVNNGIHTNNCLNGIHDLKYDIIVIVYVTIINS
jgi:hypothetical protein